MSKACKMYSYHYEHSHNYDEDNNRKRTAEAQLSDNLSISTRRWNTMFLSRATWCQLCALVLWLRSHEVLGWQPNAFGGRGPSHLMVYTHTLSDHPHPQEG